MTDNPLWTEHQAAAERLSLRLIERADVRAAREAARIAMRADPLATTVDGIAGLGHGRTERLTERFGTIEAMRNRSLEELQAESWLPDHVAPALFERLHENQEAPIGVQEEAESDNG